MAYGTQKVQYIIRKSSSIITTQSRIHLIFRIDTYFFKV